MVNTSPFFTTQPQLQCSRQLSTVKTVRDDIKYFNLALETNPQQSSVNSCGDNEFALNWRAYVRDSVINCMGKPVELDFFETIAGGKTELIPAKQMTFRQNCDYDRNIVAKSSKVGTGPKAKVKFTLHRSQHSVDGKFSYPAKGYGLFIYQDMQWCRITDVNTDVDYAHVVEVAPLNALYTVNIRGGAKMMVSPAVQVGGYTCNTDFTGRALTPGYFYKMTMLRLRVQWKQIVDLMKGYENIQQFGIMFDNEGKEINCWEWAKKIHAMEDLKYAFNLQFFTGQKATNPDIFQEENVGGDTSYPGFDGYVQQVKSAGGNDYVYDTQFGIDPETDWAALLLKQDSMKRNAEWTMLSSLNFDIAFDKNLNKMLKNANTACTFETFKRVGTDQETLKRLNINSIMLWNMTVHRKKFGALSDSRSIGNGDMPYWAFLMPSAGLVDSNGRDVPPLEFFTNQGCAEDGQFEQHQYDARDEKSGCEEVGGFMAKTVGMVAHCLKDHVIFRPRRKC